jgi:serine/threonine protein kinase
MNAVWSELGKKDVELDVLSSMLLRKELITNWQMERLFVGKRDGFYYGDYKVLYLVGAGTFSRVYRAVQVNTGAVRAIKVLRQRYSGDLNTTENFLHEAKMAMPLRHPNIVPTYEVSSDRGRHFMAMEFVEGQNLRDFVRLRSFMKLGESLNIMKDVLNGLSYAHGHGIAHRDVKLSNVLISGHGRAKLVDFGLATIIMPGDDKESLNASKPRSIDYAGLEKATKVPRGDHRSDIFFVGCMFYHMMAGRSPMLETRDRIQRLNAARFRDIAPLRKYVPNLPNNVVGMINKAMEFSPDRRYDNFVSFLSDLKKVIDTITEDSSIHRPEIVEEEAASTTDLEGDGKTLLILESRVDVQDLMRASLKKQGYRVLVTANVERASRQLEDPESGIDCLLVCTADLGRAGLQIFNAMADEPLTSDIPAILLFESAQQHLAQDAKLADHRGMMRMPVKIKRLRNSLIQLMSVAST